MSVNRRFGKLLSEGITSVARRQNRTIASVEQEIAETLGYSAHTVQRWRRGYAPTRPAHLVAVVGYCLARGRVDRQWANSLLRQAGHTDPERSLATLDMATGEASRRIFLCYGRGIEPDVSLALQLAQHLSRGHRVFFDQARELSRSTVAQVQKELLQSEFIVALLSADSAVDEVVQLEIETVFSLAGDALDAPSILPIRLATRAPLPEALGRHLNNLPWAYWRGEDDTQALLQAIEQALNGGRLPLTGAPKPVGEITPRAARIAPPVPAVHPAGFDALEGTVPLRSSYYVERTSDAIALHTIEQRNVTITIKGPRQMGKSSLLVRVGQAAEQQGKQTIFIDFQLLRPAFQEATTFFQQFCALLVHGLGLEGDPARSWRAPLPNPYLCTEFVEKKILANLPGCILLAMDDVDSLFSTSFYTDFFGMLRVWHNNRAFRHEWRALDMALVTSSEPYYFIANLSQSPFNVGEVIELKDFDRQQVDWLNEQHGFPLNEADVGRLMALLHGHPYLVRRALALVANGRYGADELFNRATADDGPFADHMRSLMMRLLNSGEMLAGLSEVLDGRQCQDAGVFFRLRGAGLVRRENGDVVVRCGLYEQFLTERLHDWSA